MARSSRPKKKRHILCIDDNAPGLAVRRAVLERWGYTVSTAVDGVAGLRVLESRPVDAVVLDFSMPGMNGELVAQTIKARWPKVRIVLLSGYRGIPKSAMDTADGFVTKGEPGRRLRNILAQLLGSARLKIVTSPAESTGQLAKKAAASVERSKRLQRRTGSE